MTDPTTPKGRGEGDGQDACPTKSPVSASASAWLVLDTATPVAVVGVVRGTHVLAEHRLSEPKRHAEGLIDAIDRALLAAGVALDDIAGVGVGRGPGSFIGVRTGIATAKGLALGRSLPLVGLPTLLAIALGADVTQVQGRAHGRGIVLIDAKRGEVYAQLVERAANGDVRAVEEARAMTPDEARALGATLAFTVGPDVTPTAAGLLRALAQKRAAGDAIADEAAALVPDYCRAPDAKLPGMR